MSDPKTLDEAKDIIRNKDALIKRFIEEQLGRSVSTDFKRERYEAFDPTEIDEVLMKFNPLRHEYSSNDFHLLGKYRLLKLVEKSGKIIFYHLDPKKDKKTIFIPALLATFFEICYNVITIRPAIYNKKDLGDMWFFDESTGTYLPNAETYFSTYVKRIWGDDFKNAILFDTFNSLMYETYIDRKDFELDPKYIPVKNGILELYQEDDKKWKIKLIENSPEFYVTERVDVEYAPNAKCPKILKFLDDLMPNQEKELKWLQQYTGYALYRNWPYDSVILLLGEGNNGKSTLLKLVRTLIGKENTITVGIYDLCNGRWYLARLYKKMANIDADTSTEDLKVTSKFKTATGGDVIQGERKFKSPFDFESYCKHYMSANKIPYCYDETLAFYRRWMIIQFGQVFRENDPKTDPNIFDKLIDELPGFLNWALEGLIELLNQNHFTDPPTAENNRILWNQLSNPIYAFIYSGAVLIDSSADYDKQKFYEDFTNYCVKHNLPRWTKDKVGKRLNQKFDFVHDAKLTDESGKRYYAWVGICPNPDFDEYSFHKKTLEKAILNVLSAELEISETITTKELQNGLELIKKMPEWDLKDLHGIAGILEDLERQDIIWRLGSRRDIIKKAPRWEEGLKILEENV